MTSPSEAGAVLLGAAIVAALIRIAFSRDEWEEIGPPRAPVREWREPVTGGATLLVREWQETQDEKRTEPRPVPERAHDGVIFNGEWE